MGNEPKKSHVKNFAFTSKMEVKKENPGSGIVPMP